MGARPARTVGPAAPYVGSVDPPTWDPLSLQRRRRGSAREIPLRAPMPNLFRALPSCVLALGLAGCGAHAAAGAVPARPAAPPPAALLPADPADTLSLAERDSIPGSIAFIAERDGNKELYSVRPTGGGERRLTERPEQDFVGDV